MTLFLAATGGELRCTQVHAHREVGHLQRLATVGLRPGGPCGPVDRAPRHAGLNAPVWAILAQEPQHGITWHMITAGVDEGEILDQRLELRCDLVERLLRCLHDPLECKVMGASRVRELLFAALRGPQADALRALIDRKAKSKTGKAIIDDTDEPSGRGSNVIDLMAALKKSVGTTATGPAKKPASKKTAPAKKAAPAKKGTAPKRKRA